MKISTTIQSTLKKLNYRPLLMLLLMLVVGASICYAQTGGGSAGATAIYDAAGIIRNYAPAVQKLMYAIAAVIVLVGAFNVYFKMQNGDQDVKKTIMLTLGGCIAFVVMAEALPRFFV